MSRTQEFIAAIKKADLNSIETLIKEGVDLNGKDEDQSSYGLYWTPLHHCIFKGGTSQNKKYTEIAELLLQNGAAIEAVNYTGETPFLFAIKFFAFDILDLLVKRGANMYAENNEKDNAFDVILGRYYSDQRIEEDHINDEEDEEVKEVMIKGEGESLTRMFNRIDALVKTGYDLNAGKFSAAYSTYLEITENQLTPKALCYLFDKGADPRELLAGKDGPFPLFDEACYRKLPDEILLEWAQKIGIDFIFEQFEDCTPLLIAICNNNVGLIKSLIASGADLHIQNGRALRMASSLGHQEITEYLVEQGAIINSTDQDGNTAISNAEEGGFTKIVDYLKSKS